MNTYLLAYLAVSIINLLLLKFFWIKELYRREKEYMVKYSAKSRITRGDIITYITVCVIPMMNIFYLVFYAVGMLRPWLNTKVIPPEEKDV